VAAVQSLDEFLGKLDFPLFILTTAADGECSGCLVGFVTQCSMHPARLLVCISDRNHTYGVAKRSAVIALHLVPQDETGVVRLFGSETGDEVDKFSRCEWAPDEAGVPLLARCPSRLVCRVLERVPVGDHVALLVEPVRAQAGPEPVFTFAMAKEQGVEPGHPA